MSKETKLSAFVRIVAGISLFVVSASLLTFCLYYILCRSLSHESLEFTANDAPGTLTAAALIAVVFIIVPGYMGWRLLRGAVSSNGVTYVTPWFLLALGAAMGIFFIVLEFRKPDANLRVIIFGVISYLLYYFSKRKPPKA